MVLSYFLGVEVAQLERRLAQCLVDLRYGLKALQESRSDLGPS
jgi:hypothetical protein